MTMNLQTIWKFLAGAVITAVVLFLLWYFSSIVVYILVSAVLAVMGRPNRNMPAAMIPAVITPVMAAARVPVAIVSFSKNPGSRR